MLTENQQRLVREIDKSIKEAKYGNVSVNVIIKNGDPVLESLNITVMKRRKYKRY